MVASGVGYHLDNFGRWLMASSPRMGGAYAALLAPGEPQPRTQPRWHFAQEYYEQRRWMACRRGALWEAARGRFQVPLTLRWYRGTTVDVTLGNDNSLCLYVCGSFEPNEFAFLDKVLRPGMVFVDVGANDGYYTLFAAQKVGEARPRAGGRAEHPRADQPQAQHRPQRPRQRHGGPGGAGRHLRHGQAAARPGRPFRPQYARPLRQ